MRAIEAFGLLGCSAITAITAQGPDGVRSIQLCDPDLLKHQIDSSFNAFDIAAVKTGMLGGYEQVKIVAQCLQRHGAKNIVLDPVIKSTSGAQLLSDRGVEALIEDLLPLADVVTPNVSELAALSGMSVTDENERIVAARSIMRRSNATVVVTGGDSETEARDLIVGDQSTLSYLDRPHVATKHSHGTGCLFSSAIAAGLADGRAVTNAIQLAKSVVYWGLHTPVIPKNGRGYPYVNREIVETIIPSRESLFTNAISGIYALTDPKLNPSRTNAEVVTAAIKGGARVIQLRDKFLTDNELRAEAGRVQAICEGLALFIVNDRVDIAQMCDADGVHLGPDDMHPCEAREQLGWDKIIGCSVSTLDEAEAVAPYASYLAVGAIFGSSTKDDAGAAVGVERIREIKSAFPGIPVVAIGGINLSNIASVAAAAADAAAVVSAIVCADDPESATRELLAEFERGKALRS